MSDTFGRISPTPFVYYDPESSCWRTSQATLALDLTPSSVTLPRSGSMRNGELFERPTLARLTGANGCSSLLPTPRTTDANGPGLHGQGGQDLRTAVQLLPTPRATDGTKGGPNQRGSSGDLMLPSAVMLLPTPVANDSGNTPENHLCKKPGRTQVTSLQIIVEYGLIESAGKLPLGVTTPPQSDDGSPPSDVQHPTPPPSGEPGALF